MQRPSAAQLWQIPLDTTLPRLPGSFLRLLPLEAHETSYLAAAARIRSLFAAIDRLLVVCPESVSGFIKIFAIYSPLRLKYRRIYGECKEGKLLPTNNLKKVEICWYVQRSFKILRCLFLSVVAH